MGVVCKTTSTKARRLDELHGPAQQLGDQGQAERHVHLAVLYRRRLEVQRVHVVRELVQRLGSRPDALGGPHTGVVTVLEQPRQYLGGDWRRMERADPREELDVM